MGTYGKLNFAVAFNPTTGFPLDARSYFTSLTAAQAAAATANDVGSSESVYYYGMDLVVVEDNIATKYIITPEKTLSPVGTVLLGDDHSIEITDDVISIKGFDTASAGQQLRIGVDGSVEWFTPDTSTVDGLSATVSGHTTDIGNLQTGKADKATTLAGYGITDGMTSTEIASSISAAIAASGHAVFQKVDTVPSAAEASSNVLYLVMNATTHYYDIYAKVENEVVLLDDTSVDFSDYSTTSQMNTAISTAVAAETSARESAVSGEATARANADTALGGRIDGVNTLIGAIPEGSTATTVVGYVDAKVAAQASSAGTTYATKTELSNEVTARETVASNLATEVSNRAQAVSDAIISAANTADTKIDAKVGDIGDVTVKTYVDGKVTTINSSIAAANSAVEAEATTARAAEQANANAIAAEKTRAEGAESALSTAIGNEATTARAAEQANAAAIDALEGLVGATAVSTQITNKINLLDVADTAEAGKYVSAVAEVDGKIEVSRASLPDYSATYDALGAAATAEANTKAYADVKKTEAISTAASDATTKANTVLGTVGDAASANTVYGAKAAAAAAQTKANSNESAISAIKDGANLDSFADVETALAGKQATGDYATKTEAQGYATTAKTEVVGASTDAKTANTVFGAKAYADDSATTKSNAAEANAKTYADGLNTAMDSRMTAAEGDIDDLESAVATLNRTDGTVGSVKKTVDDAIAAVVAGAPDSLDTLKEIADWIATDTTGAAGMASDIDALQADVGVASSDGVTATGIHADVETNAADITTLEGLAAGLRTDVNTNASDITALDTRLDTAESEIDALQADTHTHANKALLDTYSQTEVNLADAVAKKHAHANATVLDGISAAKVADWDDAVSKEHVHDNKTVLDAISATKVADWDDAVSKEHVHANADVLDGITASQVASWDAETENAIETVTINGVAQEVVNKTVNLPIALQTALGLVKGSDAENKVSVAADGTMEVNSLNVNKLVQTSGDTFVLNGGSAAGVHTA